MSTDKAKKIVFIVDDALSFEDSQNLVRSLNMIRQVFSVEIIHQYKISEDKLLSRLKSDIIDVIAVPYKLYQTWTEIDDFLGPQRVSGPVYVGYLWHPLSQNQFSKDMELKYVIQPEGVQKELAWVRRILVDFKEISATEILLFFRSLAYDTKRAGIRSWLESFTPVYTESWYSEQGQTQRGEHISNLPEIAQSEWKKRLSSIQLVVSALWGVAIEGVGPTDGTKAVGYFQMGFTTHVAAFRMHFPISTYCSPEYIVKQFLVKGSSTMTPPQLLLKFADLIRIHVIPETNDLELFVALFASTGKDKANDRTRNLWIEPLTNRLILEPPFEAPGPNNPELRALPNFSVLQQVTKPKVVPEAHEDRRIKELKRQIEERDEVIKELRTGGVGATKSFSPPDAESLLEAFQQRYSEAQFQLRQFEVELHRMQKTGATTEELKQLQLKMDALANREKSWINTLSKIIGSHESNSKSAKK